MQTIQLGNLQVEDVRQLIQESLACSRADSQALTELVYEKTQGNAFFTRQFLQNLYEEGWLSFNFDTRRWVWDIAQLKAQNITDNVVSNEENLLIQEAILCGIRAWHCPNIFVLRPQEAINWERAIKGQKLQLQLLIGWKR